MLNLTRTQTMLPQALNRPMARSLSVVALALSLLTVSAAGAQALPTRAPGTPEEQLQAIRIALVQAVSQAPMQVYNTAWIDQKGALHESTQFHSQAKVRGVRVLAYTAQGQAAPELRAATVSEAPTHWATVKGDVHQCLQSAGRWRMPVDMVVSLDPALKGRETHVGAWLAQEAAHWWRQQSGQSVRWHWDRAEVASTADAAHSSPYMRAVLGSESQRQVPWRLNVVLSTDNLRIPGWRMDVSFGRTDGSTAVWQDRVFLPAASNERASQRFVGMATLNVLRETLSQLRAEMDARGACEPSQFDVTPTAQGWVLPVGTASGFRPGDRVLVMDRDRLPQRLVEPGALGQLAMAEVVQVHPNRVQLKQIAGPALPSQGHWVALPM
jgi:chitodextrinase